MHDKLECGLFLEVGPPLRFSVIFRDNNMLKRLDYEMNSQQAAELGETLIKLAGAAEAPVPQRAKRPAAFLGAAEVN